MSMSKRIHIYTAEDVAAHKTAASCWISRNGKVYDVSKFLPDHPGGEDYILKYAGQDVVDIMKNPDEHDHSDSAYDMMEEYVIGRLGCDANIVNEGKHSAATLVLYYNV
jgi:4-hydroxysphinganine ceramide fatty acyl 2-hydroxylase